MKEGVKEGVEGRVEEGVKDIEKGVADSATQNEEVVVTAGKEERLVACVPASYQ